MTKIVIIEVLRKFLRTTVVTLKKLTDGLRVNHFLMSPRLYFVID